MNAMAFIGLKIKRRGHQQGRASFRTCLASGPRMDRFVVREALLCIVLSALLCSSRGLALPPAHKPWSQHYHFQPPSTLRLRGGRVRYEQVIDEYDLQLMRAAAAAALRMDATNPEGWLSLGDVRCLQGEWQEAREVYAEGANRCTNDLRLRQLAVDQQVYYNPGDDKRWSEQPGFEEGEIQSFEVETPKGSEGSGMALLVHASSGPIVPPDACAWIVSCAQAAGAMHGSVTAPVEAFAPTVHLHVSSLSAVVPWFNELFMSTCIPFLKKGFKLSHTDCENLRVLEAIIVRYDATPATGPGKKGLKRHVDAADYLISIALNSQDDFEGGGLWVDELESVICGPAGTVVAIDAKLSHAGMGLEKGTRHVLAVYVSRGVNKSGKKAGYTLKNLFNEPSEGAGSKEDAEKDE